ncbi:MAG: PCMD domain-containing protein [Bacteroidales bacterium]|nr:PCMD domain-containing protein [Bacteroidales bacterium]
MKKIIIALVLVSTFFASCVDEKYYTESKDCNILVFDIEGQISNRIITGSPSDTGFVEIGIPISMNYNNLSVSSAKFSPLAKPDKDALKIKDFSNDVVFTITAEDDNVSKVWKVRVFYTDAPLQLAYSNMKSWTIAKDENGNEIKIGPTYAYFPGQANVFSPWQNGARANTLAGFFSVNPKPSVENADYASMETKLYSTGALMNSAIVTGALFTGKFMYNSTYLPGIGSDPNPRKMVNLGTPFYQKPKEVKFKMRYKAGEVMKDGKNKVILENDPEGRPSKDSCEIYFLLQNRNLDANKFYRVATAWLRTGDEIGSFETETGFVEITLPFIYGEPNAQTLIENPYMKIGGVRGEVIFYKFTPNGQTYDISQANEAYAPSNSPVDNIIVLMSSSAYGDKFWGAPGSRLDVKDIEFIY